MDYDTQMQNIMNVAMHAMIVDGEIQGDEAEMLRRTADALGTEINIVDNFFQLPSLEDCVDRLGTTDLKLQALDFAFHILISDNTLSPEEETFLAKLYSLIKPGDNDGAQKIVSLAKAFIKVETDWREFREAL